jgi:hypothetical protein
MLTGLACALVKVGSDEHHFRGMPNWREVYTEPLAALCAPPD